MQFTIVSDVGSSPLKITISGGYLERLGFAVGRKVAIEEAYGKIAIRLLPLEAVLEVLPEVSPEVRPEAVPVVESVPSVEAVSAVPEVPPVSAVVPPVSEAEPQKVLFQRLSALRKEIASEVRLPPYIIFHDKTLHEMCQQLPAELEALKGISGVGQSKIEKYGSRFLEVIRDFKEQG